MQTNRREKRILQSVQLVRKPNKYERYLLRKEGHNPKYFLRVYKDAESCMFVEVMTGKILTLRR
jgi:hypothetical protein